MAPALFRTRRAIEWLSILAVGATLGAGTGSFFRGLFGSQHLAAALGTALPTFLFGCWWARLLRDPRTVGKTRIRRGWLLSIPLAAANASLSAGLVLALLGPHFDPIAALTGLFVGATFGAMFWIPALLITLTVFGVPIAWGQRLARAGLAGQERGDGIVGAVCAVVATSVTMAQTQWSSNQEASLALAALAALGGLAGVGVVAAAWWRDRLRRAFVADVEAGRSPGYRIEHTAAGKVLLRVVAQGEGYRVADFAEAVATLESAATTGVRVTPEDALGDAPVAPAESAATDPSTARRR
jgi:hypothetical protein